MDIPIVDETLFSLDQVILPHVYCVIAVSYTHLDVYKRQVYSRRVLKRERNVDITALYPLEYVRRNVNIDE